MNTQSQILSKMAFDLLNPDHQYKEKIREYAERGKEYSDLDYLSLMEITKLYISYLGEESGIDIEISKELATKILSDSDFVSFSKILGDLEYERDEIICKIIEKYKSNISEDIDEEIEYLKNMISLHDSINEIEIGSVNSGVFT